MVPSRRVRLALGTLSALGSGPAAAHSFGTIYTPPLPFWMYGWGASAALVLSFLIFGLLLRGTPSDRSAGEFHYSLPAAARAGWFVGRLLGLGLLVLCVATGLLGDNSPYGNFNMTFFWIVFALGGVYLCAVIGDFYAGLNPWRALSDAIARLWPAYARGLFRYPEALGEWPALALYFGYIWIELLGRNSPHSLGWMLLGYTILNLLGAGLVGRDAWFRHCEFFSLIFRLIGQLAPLSWTRSQLIVRPPLIAATAPARNLSLLAFILFMLSSTAFDGLHNSLFWQRLFWVDLYHAVLKTHVGANPLAAIPQMRDILLWWQTAWLLLSPLLYGVVYALFIAMSRWLGGSRRSVPQLMGDFALPLLPIALVYHVAHYYTLIQSQGIKIVQLASDPFSWGWNLFGTANWLRRSIVPDPNITWHVQVALILLGHIASVYLAHRVALRLFDSQRRAVLSQLPMLVLMLAFTTAGLWILSLPPAATN